MNTNNNSFGTTSRLKSSPIPVLFIPFKNNEKQCNYCGNEYSETIDFKQKYCKNCLFLYIKNIENTTVNNRCLDVRIKYTQCIEHDVEMNNFYTTNIQEWCKLCSEVLYFNQVIPNISSFNNLNPNLIITGFEFYNDLNYNLSSGTVKSILTKNSIPILYLSWWDNYDECVVCKQELEYIHENSANITKIQSDCRKWCSHCYMIYTGCRYCLTTNIIFGIIDQTQCKKCNRILYIDITNIGSGNCLINDFIISTTMNYNNFYRIAIYSNGVFCNYVNVNPLNISTFIINNLYTKLCRQEIKLIPHSQIKDLKKIAEGGFSIIYKATWSNGIRNSDVAIKKLHDSRNISKDFLNELKLLYQCNNSIKEGIITCYGITRDPITKEYMLVMDYANGGNLHDYLQKNFINITWEKKINILREIRNGLRHIHKNNIIHRDFHSGNILLTNQFDEDGKIIQNWRIGDLGLSQFVNDNLSNNEIYGVIPYIAPEIFIGAAFSKKSDIYSLGMIMWELTTGCKPYSNIEHDVHLMYEIIDGRRPEITDDTPASYANLMARCWRSNPSERPTIHEIYYTDLYEIINCGSFKQAERKRLELIQLKKLGPEFYKKYHSKAIYTSRALSSLISRSSTKLSSIISFNSFNVKQEYNTKEIDLDIDINNIQSSSTRNINSASQDTFNSQNQNGIYISRPLSVTKDSSRKRNFEELKIETQKNSKHFKADNSYEEIY
ncbi:kinase-like domain-containing protein [Rhizophagus diaphanus]|nr:kinase-like domain-containing protein [Rhizophagus diaphanus] [Rhizophagus sp. MUCL 43196]